MDKELTRASVDPRYTWDVTRVYADDKAWEKAFDAVKAGAQEFSDRAGTLSSGRDAVLDALQAYMALYEEMSAVYCYAMMKLHEDTTVGQYQAMNSRAATLSSDVGAKTAFLTPELLTLEEGTLESLIDDPAFADYDAFLRGVLRMKAHTLSQREEQLLAMAAEIAGVPESAYDMLSDARRGWEEDHAHRRAPVDLPGKPGQGRAQGGVLQCDERVCKAWQHHCSAVCRPGEGGAV